VKTTLAPVAPPPSPLPSPIPAPAPPPAAPTRTVAPVPPPAPPALGQPTGSVHGKGAVTLQASDFPFTLYLQTVQRKIHERWTPPPREAGGRAVIVFEINRDGSVGRPMVEDSSGDPQYDQAALRAVIDANPFPPLPEGFRESILKIHLGFDFAPYRG
jgi:protein TonB